MTGLHWHFPSSSQTPFELQSIGTHYFYIHVSPYLFMFLIFGINYKQNLSYFFNSVSSKKKSISLADNFFKTCS